MTGIFQGISLPYVVAVVNLLGLPGLIVIFWYVDQRRIANIMARQQENLDRVLEQYRNDTAKVVEMYKANVRLVEKYERMADDLSSVVHLNTQVMTRLTEQIGHNMYCPLVREKGPGRGNS